MGMKVPRRKVERYLRVKLPKATLGPSAEMPLFMAAVMQAGIHEPLEEFRFDPAREWRFDYAWPELLVAFEREGGTWVRVKCRCGATRSVFKSRHHDRDGLEADALKYNAAAAQGWLVVRATPPMLKSGAALNDLLAVLKYQTQTGGK